MTGKRRHSAGFRMGSGAPERIRTSDLCLRRAAQCNSSAFAVTAMFTKTPRKRSISHERYEADY